MAVRVLDRIPHFDERSRRFPIRTLLPPTVARVRKVWGVPADILNQGKDGACVGFGWSGELAAAPVTAKELPGAPLINNVYALGIYHQAQAEDRAMGNNWSEGASVLAGAKAVSKLGLISEYRWAFGIDDVIDSIVSHGPVVLGIPWYDSMYSTNSRGYVTVGGNVVGGHCIVAYGYVPNDPMVGADVIWWRNSWGPSYGINGTGYIRTSDLARLLSENGEACIPTDRSATPVPPTPVVDAADRALVNAVGNWAVARWHAFGTQQIADAITTWRKSKGL